MIGAATMATYLSLGATVQAIASRGSCRRFERLGDLPKSFVYDGNAMGDDPESGGQWEVSWYTNGSCMCSSLSGGGPQSAKLRSEHPERDFVKTDWFCETIREFNTRWRSGAPTKKRN